MLGSVRNLIAHFCAACVWIVVSAAITHHAAAQPCSPEWTPLGSGLEGDATFTNAPASAMTVFNDGSGPALFVGGNFLIAGGQTVNRIAKWDGHTWSPLGTGMYASGPIVAASVQALAVYDDGTGPALYAAGSFTEAGGVAANRVAKWDGATWSAVGDGITGSGAIVWSLAVYDDGQGGGPALYAAGRFTQAGSVAANRIAKWNGTTWSAVGSSTMDQEAYGLGVFNDGSGPALYVAGAFTSPATHITKWNGTAWSALSTGTTTTSGNDPSRGFSQTLAVYNGALVDGGRFFKAGPTTVNNIALWNGSAWSAMSGGIKVSNNDDVLTLAVGDVGATGSPALFAGGIFSAAGTSGAVPASNVVRWNGASWSGLGSGTNSDVYSMAVYDSGDGNGPALYVGGNFTAAGGVPVNHIARWGCNPSGACCLPSGSCDIRTNQACINAVGTYAGNNITCAAAQPCTPAPTGACCRAAGCAALWNAGEGGCASQHGLYRGDSSTCASSTCPHFELEPNGTRAEATIVTLADGESVAGFTTGADYSAANSAADSADYFRIQTAPAAPGIYLHTLTLHNETTPGNDALVPVRIQVGDTCPTAGDFTNFFPYPVGQAPVQSGNDRVSAWYGFGRQEKVYYTVTGVAPTLADPGTPGVYTATLQTSPVTPTDLGSFASGTITITTTGQGHDNDTALCVFDSSFAPIPGFSNDNATVLGGAPADLATTSFLRRTYAPGTYYLAVGISYLSSSDTTGIPCDDGNTLQVFNDFPDAFIAVDSVTGSLITDVSFSITDTQGTTPVAAARSSVTEAVWYRFTVTAPPPTGVCCRGTTCNTTVTQANCTAAAPVGAAYITTGGNTCNAGSNTTPCCYADFNKNGSLQVQDIFDFLNTWFAGSLYAKVGGDGVTGALAVADIFDFLNAWFAGGC